MYLKILNEDINYAHLGKSVGIGLLAGAPFAILGVLMEKKRRAKEQLERAKTEKQQKVALDKIAELENQIAEIKKQKKNKS